MFYNQQNNNFPNEDVIYYNCVSYGTSGPGQPSTDAEFEETRTQPFIKNPQDYFMSIVRFSIDAANVPLFICPVIYNPLNINDINLTPYRITFVCNGVEYGVNLRYIPNDDYPLPKPPTAAGVQDTSDYYYFVYYYSIMIRMINTALTTAFAQVKAANPFLAGVPDPYAIYNTTTEKVSLIFPNVTIAGVNVFEVQYPNPLTNIPAYGTTQPANTCYLYVNNLLYPFLESIETFLGIESPNDGIFLITVRDTKNNYYYPEQNAPNVPASQTLINFTNINDTYTVAPNWFILTQQYGHVTAWNSVSSIVFFTQMPIQHEFIPSFNNVNPSNSYLGASSTPILTDFVPDITRAGEQRTRFNYIPTGPYRLIDIKSTVPLNKIQFKIYWVDRFQNLYPMKITFGQTNSVKIMFIKKSYYKSLTK